MKNGIGRELPVDELHARQIVVLVKEGRPAATMWVARIGIDYVCFYAGEIKTTLICTRKPDGTLEDDTPARIRVFEYLGGV